MPTSTAPVTSDHIRTNVERVRHALRNRPGFGVGTATTRVRIADGYRCDIEDGAWTLQADLSAKSGGGGAGPDPGVLGRSAVATCLAMTYVRWAAILDVPLDDVSVEIQADYDARGEYGVTDAPPTYSEMRFAVTLDSPAPPDAVERLVEEAEAHCSWLFMVRDPQPVRRVSVRHVATR